MIYTSYFSKLRYLPNTMIPVSISRKSPRWYKGLQYRWLAPNWNIIYEHKTTHNDDLFTQRYRDEVLANRRVFQVHRDLEMLQLSRGSGKRFDVVLLSYERPGDFSHRHIVAEWLTEHGYLCEELKF